MLVLRNDCILEFYEKWLMGGDPLKTSTYYNYLGVLFSNGASFVITIMHHKIPCMPTNLLLKLFDTDFIKWCRDCGAVETSIRQISHQFCKYVLGLGKYV